MPGSGCSMLIKIGLVFLGAMLLIGMVGKVLFPGAVKRLASVRRCKSCGKPQIGSGRCACGKG